jgi:hypothetical protein
MLVKELRIADCGLRIADLCLVPRLKLLLQIQSAIRNRHSRQIFFSLMFGVIRSGSFFMSTVYRLAYNDDVARQAPGQLAVFQGASEAPISELIRVERATRKKQPTGRGPKGCVENGLAAVRRLPDRLRIDLDMRPPTASPARTALPAAHFERNDITIICETVH